MMEKIIVVAPTTARFRINTGLARRLKRNISGPIVFFQQSASRALEIDVEIEVALEFRYRHILDQRKLIDGLCVVGDRAVGIDGNRNAGPMPRNPNATNPNANTAGAIMVAASASPKVLT